MVSRHRWSLRVWVFGWTPHKTSNENSQLLLRVNRWTNFSYSSAVKWIWLQIVMGAFVHALEGDSWWALWEAIKFCRESKQKCVMDMYCSILPQQYFPPVNLFSQLIYVNLLLIIYYSIRAIYYFMLSSFPPSYLISFLQFNIAQRRVQMNNSLHLCLHKPTIVFLTGPESKLFEYILSQWIRIKLNTWSKTPRRWILFILFISS